MRRGDGGLRETNCPGVFLFLSRALELARHSIAEALQPADDITSVSENAQDERGQRSR